MRSDRMRVPVCLLVLPLVAGCGPTIRPLGVEIPPLLELSSREDFTPRGLRYLARDVRVLDNGSGAILQEASSVLRRSLDGRGRLGSPAASDEAADYLIDAEVWVGARERRDPFRPLKGFLIGTLAGAAAGAVLGAIGGAIADANDPGCPEEDDDWGEFCWDFKLGVPIGALIGTIAGTGTGAIVGTIVGAATMTQAVEVEGTSTLTVRTPTGVILSTTTRPLAHRSKRPIQRTPKRLAGAALIRHQLELIRATEIAVAPVLDTLEGRDTPYALPAHTTLDSCFPEAPGCKTFDFGGGLLEP